MTLREALEGVTRKAEIMDILDLEIGTFIDEESIWFVTCKDERIDHYAVVLRSNLRDKAGNYYKTDEVRLVYKS